MSHCKTIHRFPFHIAEQGAASHASHEKLARRREPCTLWTCKAPDYQQIPTYCSLYEFYEVEMSWAEQELGVSSWETSDGRDS